MAWLRRPRCFPKGFPHPLSKPINVPKLSKAFQCGDDFLCAKVSRGVRGYGCSFSRNSTPIKLTLEKIDDNTFGRALLHYYYFRTHEKKHALSKKVLARIGLHGKGPMEMEYVDQKYKFKLPALIDDRKREIQMFYSPLVERLVVRLA